MSMREVAGVFVLLIALAGCLGMPSNGNEDHETEDPNDSSAALEAAEIAVDLPACNVLEAFVSVEPETVRPFLPEDFTPLLHGDQAIVIFGGLSCNAPSLITARAFLAIWVETPADGSLHSSGETNYFYEPEHILENGTGYHDLATQFRSTHVVSPSVELSVSITETSLDVEIPTGVHRITTTGAPLPAPFASAFGHFREYYAADGGYGYLDTRFGTPEQGGFGAFLSTIETAPDTPARAILGQEATATALIGSDWPYDDAFVGFVPAPVSTA